MSDTSLYQKRIPIFPVSVKGRFRTLKTSILVLAYAIYFGLPWIRWERVIGPQQAVQFDIPGRRYYLFDFIVNIQDILWLAGFLIMAAMLLFMVTGMLGRAFCGYFCFQTLWTDAFIFIEHLVQGDRNARIKLSKAPWNQHKIVKIGITWLLWLLIGFMTGFTFAAYWTDAPTLLIQIFTGSAPFAAYACVLFLTATTFIFAGLAREQVCTYMCPYARFQSAMFDKDTLIVSYDAIRGERSEGRAKPHRDYKSAEARQEKGLGDCVDCNYCVQVCPMGIDIRKGLQYQCTSCALCIDACDVIMDKVGYAKGLVRYTSENALAGNKTKLLKPKTVGYGTIILVVLIALTISISNRATTTYSVEQVRSPLSVMLSDGRIQNSYEVKLNNQTQKPQSIRVSIEGLDDAVLDMGASQDIHLRPEQRLQIRAKVTQSGASHATEQHYDFVITPIDDPQGSTARINATFYSGK